MHRSMGKNGRDELPHQGNKNSLDVLIDNSYSLRYSRYSYSYRSELNIFSFFIYPDIPLPDCNLILTCQNKKSESQVIHWNVCRIKLYTISCIKIKLLKCYIF